MRVWQNFLLHILLLAAVGSHVLSYLPFMRVFMDGESYRWAEAWFGYPFASEGLDGDWWVLAVKLAIGVGIVVAGTRLAARGIFTVLLVLWFGLLFANYTYWSVTAEEPVHFRGDTLGIDIDVTLWFPIVFGVAFLLSLLWAWGERGIERHAPAWTTANSVLFVLWLLTLPVAYYLLSTGEPDGATDQYGVLLTIAGWFLFYVALLPFGRSRAAA